MCDRIDAALDLLQPLSLDWDRALRRLDELNAKRRRPDLVGRPQKSRRGGDARAHVGWIPPSLPPCARSMTEKIDTVELLEMAEMRKATYGAGR